MAGTPASSANAVRKAAASRSSEATAVARLVPPRSSVGAVAAVLLRVAAVAVAVAADADGRRGRMNIFPTWLRTGLLGVTLATAVATAPAPGLAATPPDQATYATADEAVAALIGALKQNDTAQLRLVFGPGSEQLINSGDAVEDSAARTRFLAGYAEQHALVAAAPDRLTLDVGPAAWPLPIPLVKAGDRWRFDGPAGAQELVDRRIGRNEIAAISSMLGYVAAQKTYYEMTGKAGQAEYAQRVISRPGKRDGLYWPAEATQEQSPLAEFIARISAEGYPDDLVSGAPMPVRGYLYRILTAQGPMAPGGAKSYIAQGHMTGGFALLAWPARYGASGIMTFVIDGDGVVFQRDLGPDTNKIVRSIRRYDPELSWARVDINGQ
jgi:hypothetical protein